MSPIFDVQKYLKSTQKRFAGNLPRTIHRAKFTEHDSPWHNSPRTIHRGTIHCAQFIVTPRTIRRAQFTAHNSSRHNSPRIIHHSIIQRARFTAHNSSRYNSSRTIHREIIKILLHEFLILLDIRYMSARFR
jgi:hypothetical protein